MEIRTGYMKNILIEQTEKNKFILQTLKQCAELRIRPFYNQDDIIFSGQFHVGSQDVSILILNNKYHQEIYEHEEHIRHAVRNAISTGNFVFVLVDFSEKNWMLWYRKHISYYTVQEHVFLLTGQHTIKDCFNEFINRKTPWKGMFLKDNIALQEYSQHICRDCGQTFTLPMRLYLATSDKTGHFYDLQEEPDTDDIQQILIAFKQDPSVSIPIYEYDDCLFMGLRARFHNFLYSYPSRFPYDRMAQPLVTADFSTSVPFICPHCLSTVAIVNRVKKRIDGLDESTSSPAKKMTELRRISLEPNLIRNVLGSQIYKPQNNSEIYEHLQ